MTKRSTVLAIPVVALTLSLAAQQSPGTAAAINAV